MIRRNRPEKKEPPAVLLCKNLLAAQEGIKPSFTKDSLLQTLNLHDTTPDGRTLMDRFAGERLNIQGLRAVILFQKLAYELIQVTNERTANPAQEMIAAGLGAVVTQQVIREGDICPGARHMALMSERSDIVPIEIQLGLLTGMEIDPAPTPSCLPCYR